MSQQGNQPRQTRKLRSKNVTLPKAIDQGWATLIAALIGLVGVFITILFTIWNNTPSSQKPSTSPTLPLTATAQVTAQTSATSVALVATEPIPPTSQQSSPPPDSSNLVFSDDFSTNTGKWALSSGEVNDNLGYDPGQLKVNVYRVDKKLRWEVTNYGGRVTLDNKPKIPQLDNFELEVEMRLVTGAPDDSFGITFRNGDQGLYNFFIRNGKYQVSVIDDVHKRQNDRVIIPLPTDKGCTSDNLVKSKTNSMIDERCWEENASINVNEWTRLKVKMVGNTLAIYINDDQNPIHEIDDLYLTTGGFGLIANLDTNSNLITETRLFKVIRVSS